MGWVAIVNPASGLPGAALRCGEMLRNQGLVDRLLVGERPGESETCARKSLPAEGIVVVGGDGTILEVVAGMAKRPCPIAVFPVGHGNCLARDLGATTIAKALKIFRAGRPRAIDLMDIRLTQTSGQVKLLRAVSTVSVGYVADVVAFGRSQLSYLGRAAYGVASALTHPKKLDLYLEIDGVRSPHQSRTGLVVNNSAHLGNFRALPRARLSDGRLDVMDMDYGWRSQMAHNASVLVGSSLIGPARMAQARTVHFGHPTAQQIMIDGEIFNDVVEVEVSCSPLALECISVVSK